MKKCTKCGETKPLSKFHKDKQKKSGYRPDCKVCQNKRSNAYTKKNRAAANDRNMKYKTGMSRSDYDKLLLAQGGKCKICGKPATDEWRRFAVDHDHETGYIRGLLCGHCNRGLGYFHDNREVLEAAILYLKDNYSINKQVYGERK